MRNGESRRRLIAGLGDSLGSTILSALSDDTVVEIMLNPDGQLFIERVGKGMEPSGEMTPHDAQIIMGKVAHALGTEITSDKPIISGELPIGGHRFEGLLPPVVFQAVLHDPQEGIAAHPAFQVRRGWRDDGRPSHRDP